MILSGGDHNFPAMVKSRLHFSPRGAVALAVLALAGACQGPQDSAPESRQEDNEGVDGSAGSWDTLAPLPEARQGAGLAAVGGQLYLAGGMSGGEAGEDPQPAFPLWVYEPSQGRWETPTILEEPVRGPLMAGMEGRLLVAGGWAPVEGGGWTPSSAVWRYDPELRLWTSGAPLPPGISLMGGGVVGARLHVLGTVRADTRPVHLSYDPPADKWQELTPPPSPLLDAAIASVSDQLVVAGGRREGGLPETDVWSYDPVTEAWEAVAPLPLGRAGAVAVSMDGWLYLVGGDVVGLDGGLRTTWRVDRFSLHQNLWQRLEAAPGAPGEAWAALDGYLHGIGSVEPGFAASHQRFRPPD